MTKNLYTYVTFKYHAVERVNEESLMPKSSKSSLITEFMFRVFFKFRIIYVEERAALIDTLIDVSTADFRHKRVPSLWKMGDKRDFPEMIHRLKLRMGTSNNIKNVIPFAFKTPFFGGLRQS